MSIQGSNEHGFALVDGVTRHKGKIWLGTHGAAYQGIYTSIQNSVLKGHSSVLLTYHKIKLMFSWPFMK
jgi:hypothetical protein